MAQWVKDLALSLLWLGCFCNSGLIPDPGTSVHATVAAKKKRGGGRRKDRKSVHKHHAVWTENVLGVLLTMLNELVWLIKKTFSQKDSLG